MSHSKDALERWRPGLLSGDFSSGQERTRRAVLALYSALDLEAASPSLRAAYEGWARLFSVATEFEKWKAKLAERSVPLKFFQRFGLAEEPDFGRFIFATHTLFAILAKLVTYAAIQELRSAMPRGSGLRPGSIMQQWVSLPDAAFAQEFVGMERGAPFVEAGLGGFLEGDVFGWYTGQITPSLLDALRGIVGRLAEYDFSPLSSSSGDGHDCLKELYLEIVPPAVRKALGEYYTPDSLAQRVLDLLEGEEFRGDPSKRLLDPACGSGTFLVLAINAVRRSPRSCSMEPGELLHKICRNIVGIDLNPLAVIAARANYLLALGPLLSHRGKQPLEIPVYLGDSIRMSSSMADSSRREPGHYFSASGDQSRLTPAATSIEANGPANPPPYVGGYDYVVGNPPWIGWEDLPSDYRRETKDLWHQHGLFPHKGIDTVLGKGKKDLSMLMTYVAAEHYLKEGGRLGFVITQTVFKMAGAGQGFRRFRTRSRVPLHCVRVEDYSAVQWFDGASTKAAIFLLKKGEEQQYPTPYFRFLPPSHRSCPHPSPAETSSGLRPPSPHRMRRRVADGRGRTFGRPAVYPGDSSVGFEEWAAEPSDPSDPTSAWLTGSPQTIQALKKVLGRSDYKAHQGVNTGGANAVYWFEILAADGADGVIARNLIGAAKRKIKSEIVPLEKARLFPLLKGGDVKAWRATPSAWLLFVQDPQTRRGIAESEMAKTPKAWKWLRQHQRLLSSRAAYKRFFKQKSAPFWSMFDVGNYTFKPWRVVWPRIASRLEAAVVCTFDGKQVLAQETFSGVGLDDESEAFYVAGVLNATPFRLAVSAFSQPGSKSFGTPGILERARIPRFDPAFPLHQKICAEAKRLSSGAPDASERMHGHLDALCGALWGLTDKELRALCVDD